MSMTPTKHERPEEIELCFGVYYVVSHESGRIVGLIPEKFRSFRAASRRMRREAILTTGSNVSDRFAVALTTPSGMYNPKGAEPKLKIIELCD